MPSAPLIVRLTPRARADLDVIWSFSRQQWGPRKADAYVRAIARAFDDIASGTAPGLRADDVREGYFRLLVGAHVLFYRGGGEGVIEIVRILHQRMDVSRHL